MMDIMDMDEERSMSAEELEQRLISNVVVDPVDPSAFWRHGFEMSYGRIANITITNIAIPDPLPLEGEPQK